MSGWGRRGGARAGLWLPVLGIMAALFWLSGQELPPAPPLLWDKAAHLAAYALLGLACLRATHGGFARPRPAASLAGLTLAVAYGAFDEWHQSWVPGRQPSLGDLVADAAGALFGLPALAALARVAARRGAR